MVEGEAEEGVAHTFAPAAHATSFAPAAVAAQAQSWRSLFVVQGEAERQVV